MGNKVSKVKQGGRVLSQNVEKLELRTGSTRPSSGASSEVDEASQLANRLTKLGQVQLKQDPQYYKPASEDLFTETLKARQKIEDKTSTLLESNTTRQVIPPETITAILSSIKEGDPIERITKAYNINPSIMDKLKNLSLPEFNKAQSNELLDQHAPAVPRRRKSKN